MTYDSGNYEAATAKAKELFGYDELRAEQKRRRESNDPVQLGIGVSTFTEMCGLAPSRVLGALNYGAGGWEHATIRMLADRQGRGHHRHVAARPGPRDGVEPDRRRPARRPLRGRRGAARRHPDRAQGHGHLRLALARRRWRGARPGRRQGDREGQADRGAPARGQRRRPRVHRRAASASRAPTRASAIAEVALATFAAHNLPDGRRAARSTPTRPSTRSTSPSRTAPTCAPWRSTPRPAPRRCASTSASTTSATSSTRSSSRARCTAACVQGIAQALWEEAVYDDAGHPGHRLVRRLHPADRGRHDQLRHRPHHLAVDDEHARHQGRRRGRHHRLHPGGRQRDRRRGAAPRRQRRPDAVHAGAGLEGDPVGRVALRRRRPATAQPHFADDALNQDPSAGRDGRSGTVIPAAFDYLAPDHRRRGPRGARRRAATTPR